MAEYIFPAWWYGPRGEQQVFERFADVPKGWQEHPFLTAKPPTTDEVLSETSDELKAAQAEIEKLKADLAEAVELARERIGLEEQADRLQTENADLKRRLAEADKSGDGVIEPSLEEVKAALDASGVEYDGRWGLARLQALLEAHKQPQDDAAA